jgi:hypothetical protein
MGSESGPLPRRHCGKGQRRSRALSVDPFSVPDCRFAFAPVDRYVGVCFRALPLPRARRPCTLRFYPTIGAERPSLPYGSASHVQRVGSQPPSTYARSTVSRAARALEKSKLFLDVIGPLQCDDITPVESR